jgi:hypothetical protein
MKRFLVGLALAWLLSSPALADYAFTQGAGTTAVAFDATHSGTSRCAAALTQCFASVPMDVSGTALFSSSNPGQVTLANTGANATAIKVDGSAVTQPVSGTVTARAVGNAGAIFDFAGQNAASPANAILTGGQFNTTPTTLTTGNVSPLQLDSAGNLLTDMKSMGGTAIGSGCVGALNGFSTAIPATVCGVFGVYAINSNTNGQATMANSAPVAIASNQAWLGTSNGWTPSLLNALSTTVKSIKSSASGQLGMLVCSNTNASVGYVQVFDVATSGGVTLGTTTPKLSLAIPATNSDGFTLSIAGVQFANGIQVAATTTATGLTALGTALDCNAAFN